VKRRWVTCTEHPHCQQEIRTTQWDDKPNEYIVVHHRDAKEQPDSLVSPERWIRAYELRSWLDQLEERAAAIGHKTRELDEVKDSLARGMRDIDSHHQRYLEEFAVASGKTDRIEARVLDELRRSVERLSARLDTLEERSRPWRERMKGAR
jgi:hypothetical protein